MTALSHPASRQRGALLLADISGYTGFLQGIAEAHAELNVEETEPAPVYSLLSSLFDTMAATLAPSFVVMKLEHHGDYVLHRIVGREELAGPEVIVAHRLLKNHAREVVGVHPYALLTDAALRALDVPTEEMPALTETYDGLPPIPSHLLVLD